MRSCGASTHWGDFPSEDKDRKFGRLLLRRAPGGGAGGGGRPVRRALCDAGSHHPQPGRDGPSGRAMACGRWSGRRRSRRGATVIIRSHGESRAVHEGLHARGVRILDATCPNVTRIHQIVARAEEQGRQPIIIGTRDHPEVLAIAGWCCRPVVLSGAEELENWLAEDPSRRQMPLTFVSQTTAIRRVWDSCVKKAKKECTNAEFFDTICGCDIKTPG